MLYTTMLPRSTRLGCGRASLTTSRKPTARKNRGGDENCSTGKRSQRIKKSSKSDVSECSHPDRAGRTRIWSQKTTSKVTRGAVDYQGRPRKNRVRVARPGVRAESLIWETKAKKKKARPEKAGLFSPEKRSRVSADHGEIQETTFEKARRRGEMVTSIAKSSWRTERQRDGRPPASVGFGKN